MNETERQIMINLAYALRRARNALSHPLTVPATCLPIEEILLDAENALNDASPVMFPPGSGSAL